jgi:hypothetical protein
MKGLKDELDLAKKAIEDSFGVVDLKPQVQQYGINSMNHIASTD